MARWAHILAPASRRRASHLLDLAAARSPALATLLDTSCASSIAPFRVASQRQSTSAPANAAPATPPPAAAAATSAPAANYLYHEIYNRQRQLIPINYMVPDVAVDAWVAPNAILAGGVTIDDRASVWYGSVLRADLNYIRIGAYSNIQDRVVVHAASASPTGLSAETTVGRYVTVGQNSVLRSCEIEDEVVIGQRCLVLEGAIVEKNAVLADCTVVGPGQLIPGGQLWAGSPAKFVRELTADEVAEIPKLAESAHWLAEKHKAEFLPYSTAYIQAEKLKAALKASSA
ncbi:unnamed protein product [Closterium sp. Yama58-4]|nr:unnamed protein product [Closterium sp. Yama58-4]